jgi:WD repeat-containing protein 48
MLIRFPSQQQLPTRIRTADFQTQIQSLTLRRITELISPHPNNHFPLPSFEKFTDHVFPSSTTSTSTPTTRLPFTLGGVMFHPIPNQKHNTHIKNEDQNENTWLLTRQPYMRNRSPSLPLDLPRPDSKAEAEGETIYSPWKLWDNRFWVRAAVVPVPDKSTSNQNPDMHAQYTQSTQSELNGIRRCVDAEGLSLIVRPLRQSDLQLLRAMGLTGGQGRGKKHPHQHQHPALVVALQKRLAREAPGQARFTIPVLVVQKNAHQVPLALPTLSCRLLSASQAQSLLQASMPWTVRWQWMYKMIDQDPLKLMGWL